TRYPRVLAAPASRLPRGALGVAGLSLLCSASGSIKTALAGRQLVIAFKGGVGFRRFAAASVPGLSCHTSPPPASPACWPSHRWSAASNRSAVLTIHPPIA